MKILRSLSAVLLLALAAVGVRAQGSNGGILYASDFAQWNLPQGTGPAAGSIAWPDSTICTVGSTGYNFVAPKVGRKLLLIDAVPSLTETITPTTVIDGPGSCQLNAPMVHQHTSYNLRSGTAAAS